MTGAGGWDINADENPLFDYNDTVRDAGEAAFERESTALPLYAADPYRSSDHDPAIVGLDLTSPNRAPVARITGPTTVRVGPHHPARRRHVERPEPPRRAVVRLGPRR